MSVFFIDSSKRSAVTQSTRELAAPRQPRPAGLHSTAPNLGTARFRVGILGNRPRIGYRPGRRRGVFQPMAKGCSPLIDRAIWPAPVAAANLMRNVTVGERGPPPRRAAGEACSPAHERISGPRRFFPAAGFPYIREPAPLPTHARHLRRHLRSPAARSDGGGPPRRTAEPAQALLHKGQCR